AVGIDPLARTPPRSRRRPRRRDVVTYRVRIDLQGTKPPLWRRLEFASDLYLDDVHAIIQAAFGWTDSHLHRFGSGPQYYSHETEYYLCPFEVDEGEVGVPEDKVRLDEVLVDVGDTLFYVYDFGDDWHHTIRLEAVVAHDGGVPRAVCTAGRRPGPAEDCGGAYGYELIVAATDPAHPDHAEGAAEFARFYGDDVDPAMFDIAPFDIDEINSALADLGLDAAGPHIDLPELPAPLDELLRAVGSNPDRRVLRRLIGAACLHEPVRVDAETAARMVGAYTWLLNRVGADGIKLTAAGYLPPVHVEAAMAELGLEDEWIGRGNREIQTTPVLHLRESAQKMGLLRRHRGSLVLTARGRSARSDPVALWWHQAERMPPRSRDAWEVQAGIILLVAVAARATDDLDRTIARFLDAIGWMTSDRTPLTDLMASRAACTKAVLRRLGAVTDDHGAGRRDRPTADGVAFARAALRTWT
ncbi:MAG: plasmid pRiA4b ORF-3 family protein, partial [Actinomycetota bacterium]|nr:plasmid pRiA4b ORF-3 family protein [Actinomycetota bacterium]